MNDNKIDVLAVMDECRAYVDDAAQFPEQFKPGVVKRHQRQYIEARAAVAELIEAASEVDRLSRDMTAWDDPESVNRALLRQRDAIERVAANA